MSAKKHVVSGRPAFRSSDRTKSSAKSHVPWRLRDGVEHEVTVTKVAKRPAAPVSRDRLYQTAMGPRVKDLY
jgi:hypothetical protein